MNSLSSAGLPRVPGSIDPTTGEVHRAAGNGADDALDDLAEMALRTHAMVQVISGSVMPTKTGLAAIYRY
jgi:hypothetical protein